MIDVLDPSKPNLGRPIGGVDIPLLPDPIDPSPRESRVVQHMRGGSVWIEARGETLYVSALIPQPGYVSEVSYGDDRVEIRFVGPVPGTTLIAWIEDGALMTELVQPEPSVTRG